MKFIYKVLLVFSCLVFLNQKAEASHAMGVDLSYQHLFGDVYEITLTFYRDCSGNPALASYNININSPSSCGATASVNLPLVGSGTEVSPLCAASIVNSTCNGGTLPGVEQYIYRGTYTFPTKCTDWNMSYALCCRNPGPSTHNLINASSQNIYIEATLDNTGTINNSSPQFTSIPVPYICQGQSFSYNHGAFDPDGDSLVYTLVNALDGPYPGNNITYSAPATPTNPVVGAANIFDSQTGSLTVNPDGTDVAAVMTVLVEEYRGGVLIGSTMRDIQIVVQVCTNTQPQDPGSGGSGGIQNLTGGGLKIDSNSVEICPGATMSFDLFYTDPNAGDIVTVTSNLALVIPGSIFSTVAGNPATATFTWTPTAADIGFHNFTVTVQDDGCPILGSQVYAFDITVLDGTYAGSDLNYCPAGLPVTMNAAGGTTFDWFFLSGASVPVNAQFNCNPCASPSPKPNVTTTYVVVSDLSATCKNRDTVIVNRVADITSDPGANVTICKYGSTTLTAATLPVSEGPFTYSWMTTDSLSAPTSGVTDANPLSTTEYFVTTTSAAGCIYRDSITVNVVGVAPNGLVNIPNDSICAGDNTDLLSVIYPDVCETTTIPCSGPVTSSEIINGTSATSTYSPFYHSGSGYSNRKQYMYTAAQLHAQGFIEGGRINSFELYFTTANTSTTGLTIKMGCTSINSFSNGNFITGLSVVKNPYTATPAVGWNTFTLDNAYMWDGVSNLIVELCTDNTQSGTSSSIRYGSTSPSYQCIYANNLGAGACSDALGFRTVQLPNIRFNWCTATPAAITYSWAPSGGSSANANVSPGSTTNFTVTMNDAGCISTADRTVYVGTAFNLNTTATNTICFGNNINISSAPTTGGSYTYNWSPSTFVTSSNTQSTTASPISSMHFHSTVSNGICTRQDSVLINVAGGPISATASVDSICPGSTTNLLVTTSGGSISDDFDALDMSNWSAINNGTANSSCGSMSGNALHFNGNSGLTRSAETITLNTSICTVIDFCLIFGSGSSPCENADSGEGIELQYSNDGGTTWFLVTAYGPDAYITWTCFNVSIPIAAQTASTMFRWVQPSHSGSNTDNWAIDNVVVNCASGASLNYTWSPGGTLSNSIIPNPVASPTSTTIYSVTGIDPLNPSCPSNTQISIGVNPENIVATGSNLVRCTGDVCNISTALSSPIPPDCDSYTISTVPYVWETGGWINVTSTMNGDGGYTSAAEAIPIGFSFDFYCNTYTNIYGSANGYLSFIALTTSGGYSNGIPVASTANNQIAFATEDLVCFRAHYKTIGSAPNRVFIFKYIGYHWNDTNEDVDVQIKLFETSNIIEIHSRTIDTDAGGATMTMGIENNTGTIGVTVTGRNDQDWTASNEAYRFSPDAGAVYSWSPSTGLSDITIENPVYTAPDNTTRDFVVACAGGFCTLYDTITIGCLLADENVELKARAHYSKVRLSWENPLIDNLSHFEIFRSENGIDNFKSLGKATSNIKNDYFTFDDNKPLISNNYYKLKIVRNDESYTYSNIVDVKFNKNNNLSIYPNPFNSGSSFYIELSTTGDNIDVQLFDLSGRKVDYQTFETTEGENTLEYKTSELSTGTYIYKIKTKEGVSIGKLIMND